MFTVSTLIILIATCLSSTRSQRSISTYDEICKRYPALSPCHAMNNVSLIQNSSSIQLVSPNPVPSAQPQFLSQKARQDEFCVTNEDKYLKSCSSQSLDNDDQAKFCNDYSARCRAFEAKSPQASSQPSIQTLSSKVNSNPNMNPNSNLNPVQSSQPQFLSVKARQDKFCVSNEDKYLKSCSSQSLDNDAQAKFCNDYSARCRAFEAKSPQASSQPSIQTLSSKVNSNPNMNPNSNLNPVQSSQSQFLSEKARQDEFCVSNEDKYLKSCNSQSLDNDAQAKFCNDYSFRCRPIEGRKQLQSSGQTPANVPPQQIILNANNLAGSNEYCSSKKNYFLTSCKFSQFLFSQFRDNDNLAKFCNEYRIRCPTSTNETPTPEINRKADDHDYCQSNKDKFTSSCNSVSLDNDAQALYCNEYRLRCPNWKQPLPSDQRSPPQAVSHPDAQEIKSRRENSSNEKYCNNYANEYYSMCIKGEVQSFAVPFCNGFYKACPGVPPPGSSV